MPRIHLRACLACAAAALATSLVSSPATASDPSPSIVHLKTMHDGRPVEGTGVVIGIDERRGHVFVMTAAALFRRDNGEPAAETVQVEFGSVTAAVRPDQILRPRGDMGGIAVLRVEGWQPEGNVISTEAIALDYQSPALGGVFVIAVAGPAGQRIDVPERVQFGATRLVVGDRSVAHLPACVGAPALSAQGVFGTVVDCAPGRAPVVALVTTVRRFLERQLPGAAVLTSHAAAQAGFAVSERLLSGPLLTVACDAVNAGEIEVPFTLARNERPVDAAASLLNASSVRLGDVTVLGLTERVVKLRFTLVGVPLPHFSAPETCARGQALVTVRLNVVTVPD
jgi:hypothetical protein